MSDQELITYDLTKLTGPDDAIANMNGNKITFTAVTNGDANKTYTYKVSKGSVSRTVTISVQHAVDPTGNGNNVSYRVVTNGSSFDSVFNARWADNWNKNAEVKVGVYTNGVLYAYDSSVSNIIVKRGSTNVNDDNYVTVTGGIATVNVRSITGSTVVKAPTGSYTVSLTIDKATYNGSGTLVLTSGFVVTDSQKSMTSKQISTSASGNFAEMIKNSFEFYYDGGKADQSKVTIIKVYSPNAGDKAFGSYSGQVVVTKVDLTYVIDEKIVIFYGVSIGKTITATQ